MSNLLLFSVSFSEGVEHIIVAYYLQIKINKKQIKNVEIHLTLFHFLLTLKREVKGLLLHSFDLNAIKEGFKILWMRNIERFPKCSIVPRCKYFFLEEGLSQIFTGNQLTFIST